MFFHGQYCGIKTKRHVDATESKTQSYDSDVRTWPRDNSNVSMALKSTQSRACLPSFFGELVF